ncbi:MAG: hypothetical protein ACT6Q5_14850 [Sphingopyxis solisilvae]|uniref:hypothetical protein n=1 Tax=Sphingopyxis solisilvae TaxID=1886788 RepID=UPI004035AB35
MKWNMDRPSNRKRVLYSAFALVAVGYIFLPYHLGLSDMHTDALASMLLALALSAYLYEDHRGLVPSAPLIGNVLIAFLAVLGSAIAVLCNGIRFQALIPISMVIVGASYWYLNKRKASASVEE